MGAEDQKMEAKEKPRPNPITESQFLSWKRLKDADESARKAEVARKRAEDIAAGTLQMNGRELFLHEPQESAGNAATSMGVSSAANVQM